MSSLKIRGTFYISARDREGRLVLNRRLARNSVVDGGLNLLRNWMMNGVALIDPFVLVPLKSGVVVAFTDTYEVHPGWEEFINYDETERREWLDFAPSTGVASNVGFEAVITISAGTDAERTIGGVALFGGGDDLLTKGDEDGGSLVFSVAAVDDGDIVFPEGFEVTIRYDLEFLREE